MHMHMRNPSPSTRYPKRPHAATHLSLGKDLTLIVRPIKLHRLDQLHFRNLLSVLGPERTRPHNPHVPVDLFLMAHQPRGLVGRQAGFGFESARVTVDVVVPLIGAEVVVELADFDRTIPAEVSLELALFRGLVAEVGQVEGLDLAGDVVEDGGVGGLRRGAEDVAVGFWCVRLASCLTCRFVGSPLAFLALLTAVFGTFASAAHASAGFRTRRVGADLRHDGI